MSKMETADRTPLTIGETSKKALARVCKHEIVPNSSNAPSTSFYISPAS